MHSQRLARYAACLFTGIALTAILRAQATGSGADEKAIRSMMAATTDAFSNHDAKAWARYSTPTARLVTIRGESMDGAAAIEKGLTSIFQTRGKTARLRSLVKDAGVWKIAAFHNTMLLQ